MSRSAIVAINALAHTSQEWMDIRERRSAVAPKQQACGVLRGSGQGGFRDMSLPWVEKYRPTDIHDVVGNEETINRLAVIAEHGNMPNLIIAGPPGTGKTTSVLCLAHALLGENYREAVLDLNASDDRGIEVVRSKIKSFAQKKVVLPEGRHKIVILDEADNMTSASQQAMRRTMELYSATTRFALACNISSDIIEPIQSRCAILRFTRLTDKQVVQRLLKIIKAEEVMYDDHGLEVLCWTADGDMRQAINNLQATNAGYGFVSAENVQKVCDQPHPVILQSVIANCLKGCDVVEKDGTSPLNEALKAASSLFLQGYAAVDIVGSLNRVVKTYDMEEFLKLEFLREVGFAQMRCAQGLDTHMQLSGLVARLSMLSAKVREEGLASLKK